VNQPEPERSLAAILVADVAGYSRLMGRDEEGTLARRTGSLAFAIIDASFAAISIRRRSRRLCVMHGPC
jgi:adenylate cyclase